VSCGALTETMVESELFGQERGAFTGAVSAQQGWFEAADRGTLFLDEIGELPAPTQVKLLRVLQEREVVRLGSRRSVAVDVRLIAATNVDLAHAVRAGKFREDLFYRISVAPVVLPPLRVRPGDIAPLASHFLDSYAARLGRANPGLEPAALARLLAHDWPGNIRELENVIHYALLVSAGGRIGPADLHLAGAPGAMPASAPGKDRDLALESALRALFERRPPRLWDYIEETVMRAAFEYSDQNQLETARLLGISRNVVRARLISFGFLAGAKTAPRQ
jgi:sigma-54-specific transcriptional regulator